jgi:putative ABC transport system substrate-binding protein
MTETGVPYYRALLQELRQLGYVEGYNLIVERHSGEGRVERYADLVRNVVRSNPDVIFTQTAHLVKLFKSATETIPIVAYLGDPVAHGLVASLTRPGGNITGIVADAGLEVQGKLIELLEEALGGHLTRLGILMPRALWDQPLGLAMRAAAEQRGIRIVGTPLDNFQAADYRRAFGAFQERHADAVLVSYTAEHFSNRDLIVELARRSELPAIYPDRIFVEYGGLMSYGFDLPALYRRAAGYIVKILQGANPGHLPMEQPTEFQFVMNLRTAQTLGIDIPTSLLADEVIK